jgi:hypothetical protein
MFDHHLLVADSNCVEYADGRREFYFRNLDGTQGQLLVDDDFMFCGASDSDMDVEVEDAPVEEAPVEGGVVEAQA